MLLLCCSPNLWFVVFQCPAGSMVLGHVWDTKSAAKIPPLPQGLADIFADITLYFLPESPTQKNRYANSFLPAPPIFPGSSRSLVQIPRWQLPRRTQINITGIWTNPSPSPALRPRHLSGHVLKSPSPRLLSRCLMSSYLENCNKVSGLNPARLLWGGAVLELFSDRTSRAKPRDTGGHHKSELMCIWSIFFMSHRREKAVSPNNGLKDI